MARPTSTADFPRLLEFQRRGLLDIESLISDRIALDGINDAFAACGRCWFAQRGAVLSRRCHVESGRTSNAFSCRLGDRFIRS